MIEMATKSSDQETVGFTCFWRIENFRLGDDIDSPKFRVKMLQNSEWSLTLESESNNKAGVYLEKSSKKGCINIGYTISLLKVDGSNLILVTEENHTFEEGEGWGCDLDQEDINNLLQEVYEQNGTLTLICHMWNEFSVKNKPVQYSITTRLENERHVFKLPIEKFSSLAPGDKRNFSISCIHFEQPQLDIIIHLEVDREGCFKCKMQKINTTTSPVLVHCRIMATAKDGLKTQLSRMIAKFQNGYRQNRNCRHFQFPKSLQINLSTAKEKFDLSDDVLNLYYELLVGTTFKALPQEEEEGEEEEAVISNDTQTDSTEKCTFSEMDDLMNFFKEKKFCYVTLRTTSKEFGVHKALLCARSPVFRAMFERDMIESGSNIVNIDDVDSDTISLLLNFLYLEPIVDLKWEAASKLFYAADKYQIEELKSKCVCSLISELTVENVCEAFLLSDMHHDESLKNSAQKFFCENSKSILCSKEWNEFLMSRTELASEILRIFATKL